jgi:hypothetical protein
VVDIFREDWLNEVKIGYQRASTANTKQVLKDKWIVQFTKSGQSNFTHNGENVTANGGDWWFGYKHRGCQNTGPNRCPNMDLRGFITQRHYYDNLVPHISLNIVYVWRFKGCDTDEWVCNGDISDSQIAQDYSNTETARKIANALDNDNWPDNALSNIGLPYMSDPTPVNL